MKYILVIFTIGLFTVNAYSQKHFTRTGHIWFYSSAPLEDIEAHNYQVTSILDTEKNELVFSLLMKGFEFEKALMQEHFNEKYVESEQYPKSEFKGKIVGMESTGFTAIGKHNATVVGDLTIHGITKTVEAACSFDVKKGEIAGTAKFTVKVTDYNISIPSVVKDNIAEEIEITVNVAYKPMQ